MGIASSRQNKQYILAGNYRMLDELFNQRDQLAMDYINLQADIGLALKDFVRDGDRANDPIINRVRRVAAEAKELRSLLCWIVVFCQEHPEWFGEGTPDQAEFEWLVNAQEFLERTAS